MQIARIGLDLAKYVFEVHGVDCHGKTVLRRTLRRGAVMSFFANLPPCLDMTMPSRWHLDEMAVLIAGRRFWLWRAVDDEGEVLDLLVQRRHDARAAAKLMCKLLKK